MCMLLLLWVQSCLAQDSQLPCRVVPAKLTGTFFEAAVVLLTFAGALFATILVSAYLAEYQYTTESPPYAVYWKVSALCMHVYSLRVWENMLDPKQCAGHPAVPTHSEGSHLLARRVGSCSTLSYETAVEVTQMLCAVSQVQTVIIHAVQVGLLYAIAQATGALGLPYALVMMPLHAFRWRKLRLAAAMGGETDKPGTHLPCHSPTDLSIQDGRPDLPGILRSVASVVTSKQRMAVHVAGPDSMTLAVQLAVCELQVSGTAVTWHQDAITL